MPIKNSLKIFASKFSMVYSILLYLVIATVVLASVSVFALIPVYRFLEAEGVTSKAGDVITKFVINGYSSELFEQTVECLEKIDEVMRTRSDLVVLTALYFTLFIGVFCRLVYGMLELPMLKKIKGAMSDNADYGFIGLYVSCFGKSFVFSLCKIMLKILADAIVLFGVLLLSEVLMFSSAKVFIPFIDCIILVAYFTFSHCITACWGASVATDGRSLFGLAETFVENVLFRLCARLRNFRHNGVFAARNKFLYRKIHVRRGNNNFLTGQYLSRVHFRYDVFLHKTRLSLLRFRRNSGRRKIEFFITPYLTTYGGKNEK